MLHDADANDSYQMKHENGYGRGGARGGYGRGGQNITPGFDSVEKRRIFWNAVHAR